MKLRRHHWQHLPYQHRHRPRDQEQCVQNDLDPPGIFRTFDRHKVIEEYSTGGRMIFDLWSWVLGLWSLVFGLWSLVLDLGSWILGLCLWSWSCSWNSGLFPCSLLILLTTPGTKFEI